MIITIIDPVVVVLDPSHAGDVDSDAGEAEGVWQGTSCFSRP